MFAPVDPILVAYRLFSDLNQKESPDFPLTQRCVPLSTLCSSNLPDILKALSPLLKSTFGDSNQGKEMGTNLTFSVQPRIRNCSKLDRMVIIDAIVSSITKLSEPLGKEHKVKLEGADVVILVEVIQVNGRLCSIEFLFGRGRGPR